MFARRIQVCRSYSKTMELLQKPIMYSFKTGLQKEQKTLDQVAQSWNLISPDETCIPLFYSASSVRSGTEEEEEEEMIHKFSLILTFVSARNYLSAQHWHIKRTTKPKFFL